MTDKSEQGKGKHAHKDSAEPWPHTKEPGKQQQQSGKQSEMRAESRQSGGAQERQSGSSKGQAEQEKDLKAREYRDKQGNIHHHTHTSSEMKDRKAG